MLVRALEKDGFDILRNMDNDFETVWIYRRDEKNNQLIKAHRFDPQIHRRLFWKNLFKSLKKTSQSDIFIVLERLIIIFTLVSVIFSGYIFIKQNFTTTFFPKIVEYRKINKLSTEVDIKYFNSILGNEISKNSYSDMYTEYIYFKDDYFVQAITDTDDTVKAYSVTTLRKNFNPTWDDIELGKSTFQDVHNKFGETEDIISIIGVHDYFYTEGYYLANPGNYQTVYFSSTIAGYSGKDFKMTPTISPKRMEDYNSDVVFEDGLLDSEKEILRENFEDNHNIVNTYTETSPAKRFEDFNLNYMYGWGPDWNKVRVWKILDFKSI